MQYVNTIISCLYTEFFCEFLLPGNRYQTQEGSGDINDDEDGDADEFIQSKGIMVDWKHILVDWCMGREYTKAGALWLEVLWWFLTSPELWLSAVCCHYVQWNDKLYVYVFSIYVLLMLLLDVMFPSFVYIDAHL